MHGYGIITLNGQWRNYFPHSLRWSEENWLAVLQALNKEYYTFHKFQYLARAGERMELLFPYQRHSNRYKNVYLPNSEPIHFDTDR